MPWTARLHEELPIIEMCYVGVVTESELAEAVRESRRLAAERETAMVLADCTAMMNGPSAVAQKRVADTYASDQSGRPLRRALVLPVAQAAIVDVLMWETLCLKRGVTVRLFKARQSAIEWLLRPSS